VDVPRLTDTELAELHARPTRYFLDDYLGTLHRFAFNPDHFIGGDPNGRFYPQRGEWVPDESRTADEHMMRGGYLTEITAEQAASLRTREEGLALLASLGHNRPYL